MRSFSPARAAEEGAAASTPGSCVRSRAAVMAQGISLLLALALLAVLPFFVRGQSREARPRRGGQADGVIWVPEAPQRLVMDVDAGVDDALAMLAVLGAEKLSVGKAGPRLRLEAVTCVHGNTKLSNVVQNVLKTLDTAGRLDIPVYAGAPVSLLTTPPSDNYFGEDGFGDIDYPNPPDPGQYLQKEHAVNALTRIARENPGEITLLAIGSLTNIALAIRMDPGFLGNLKQLAVLGGSVKGVGNVRPGKEFNFYMDPAANFIVFNSTIDEKKPVFLVTWETSSQNHNVSIGWRKQVLGAIDNKAVELINKAEHNLLDRPDDEPWTSADTIASALLLNPDFIAASEQHHVDLETEGRYGKGAIFVDYNNELVPRNALLTQAFDSERLKDFLIKVYSAM